MGAAGSRHRGSRQSLELCQQHMVSGVPVPCRIARATERNPTEPVNHVSVCQWNIAEYCRILKMSDDLCAHTLVLVQYFDIENHRNCMKL